MLPDMDGIYYRGSLYSSHSYGEQPYSRHLYCRWLCYQRLFPLSGKQGHVP